MMQQLEFWLQKFIDRDLLIVVQIDF